MFLVGGLDPDPHQVRVDSHRQPVDRRQPGRAI
jgi:hypothetical protein